jgi:hypothetical protein
MGRRRRVRLRAVHHLGTRCLFDRYSLTLLADISQMDRVHRSASVGAVRYAVRSTRVSSATRPRLHDLMGKRYSRTRHGVKCFGDRSVQSDGVRAVVGAFRAHSCIAARRVRRRYQRRRARRTSHRLPVRPAMENSRARSRRRPRQSSGWHSTPHIAAYSTCSSSGCSTLASPAARAAGAG